MFKFYPCITKTKNWQMNKVLRFSNVLLTTDCDVAHDVYSKTEVNKHLQNLKNLSTVNLLSPSKHLTSFHFNLSYYKMPKNM
jgi:hypothetical protein